MWSDKRLGCWCCPRLTHHQIPHRDRESQALPCAPAIAIPHLRSQRPVLSFTAVPWCASHGDRGEEEKLAFIAPVFEDRICKHVSRTWVLVLTCFYLLKLLNILYRPFGSGCYFSCPSPANRFQWFYSGFLKKDAHLVTLRGGREICCLCLCGGIFFSAWPLELFGWCQKSFLRAEGSSATY